MILIKCKRSSSLISSSSLTLCFLFVAINLTISQQQQQLPQQQPTLLSHPDVMQIFRDSQRQYQQHSARSQAHPQIKQTNVKYVPKEPIPIEYTLSNTPPSYESSYFTKKAFSVSQPLLQSSPLVNNDTTTTTTTIGTTTAENVTQPTSASDIHVDTRLSTDGDYDTAPLTTKTPNRSEETFPSNLSLHVKYESFNQPPISTAPPPPPSTPILLTQEQKSSLDIDDIDDAIIDQVKTISTTTMATKEKSSKNFGIDNPKATLNSSISTASPVHPLLIYSVRYEIKGYDLFNPLSWMRSNNTAITNFYDPHHHLSGKHTKTLIGGLKNTIGIDFLYSESESYIFWTDVIEERIYRGTIAGSGPINNVETIVQAGLATAEGLAIDWIGLNIYWVESTLDHIEVANINGTSRRTLIAGDMESPRAIAVDPRYGLLFWSDWDKKRPRIERSTMAGEDRKTLVNIKEVNGGWPNGLTLDYDALKVYWIDANSDSIHVVDYDGNNHQPVLKHFKSLSHPFSITLFGDNLFWTDWKTNSLSVANKHNASDAREFLKFGNRLFDVKVFHPSRQPKIENELNPCFFKNGNCSHLCLLSTVYTRRCACPNLMILSQDDMTCETHERVLLIGRTNEIRALDMNEPLHNVMAPISVPKVFNPRQFEYDTKTKTIYWADSNTNEVKKTQLNGNNIDTVIDVIIESPSGLALDWISGNIYVTSASQHKNPGKIYISNLNGEYISILMDGSHGLGSPKSIAVHPILGLLFCIDEGLNNDVSIFVANMDGSSKRIIASKFNNPKLNNPPNLAIDYELNRVYWVNQASNTSEKASIQYYDIFDDKIITILDENEIPQSEQINPGVLCVDGDHLIVSGRVPSEVILKLSKHNLKERTTLRTQNMDQISALRVYNASSQVGTNACSVNNGDCSQLCIPTNATHRTCKCTMGYSLSPVNKTECFGKDLFLIYSNNLGMKGISLEPNAPPDDYYLPSIHRAFRASSIDYVFKKNLIYWVDNEEGSITRINRDTTNYQVIVQGLEAEESIGVDWVAGNIYWLDPYYDIIEVARLNGSNRYVIVSGGMEKANGIVVNPLKGYIVWSDVGSSPKIETALLDGSNRRILVNSNLTHIDDLAIDYVDDYIYWVDSTLPLIERIRQNGTGRQVIYSSAQANHGPHNQLVSITIYKNYLFIQHQGSLIRCDKNTGLSRQVVQQHLGDGVRDIAIFAEQPMPSPEENPCIVDNGGCQDLCIFMGEKGNKRCICSHGKLNKDGLTCAPYDTFILYSKLLQIESLHIKDNNESFNNSPYPPIVNRSNTVSLTVDYHKQRVIFSDIARNQICSVKFDGTDRRILVKDQVSVEGIAFYADQLYWTSVHDSTISRLNTTSLGVPQKTCDPSGDCRVASVEKIVSLTSEDRPRGIAIDSCTSYVYWTNWNTNAAVQRASPYHGNKVESIITTEIKVPNGIAIDQSRRKLYWCDARLDKIEVTDMDGTNRAVLISATPQHPFALAIWENYIFWSDWLAKGIFKADKYTGKQSMLIKKVAPRPYGIAVAAPDTFTCNNDVEEYCKDDGHCPAGTRCVVINPTNHGAKGLITGCRIEEDSLHQLRSPHHKVGPCRYSTNESCEHSHYHDIIMDSLERYNFSEPIYLEPKPLDLVQQYEDEPKHARENSGSLIPKITTEPTNVTARSMLAYNDTSVFHLLNENYTTPIKSWPATTKSLNTTEQTNSEKSAPVTPETTAQNSNSTTGSIATIRPSQSKTSELPTTISTYETDVSAQAHGSSTTGPPQNQSLQVNATIPPCQIVPAALQPTTDSSSASECKSSGHFKCYLSEKIVCIQLEKHCDGHYDCPNKEDENDCSWRTKPLSYKRYTNWTKFVSVILIIFTAAVAALFLVFGTRGRRRWFIGKNRAFNHRRMFDDNGTNIEISNPMFDEDDSGNLVHCAFSIDLNERTTNFSNPLYERQVLLMNDKHVTSN